MNYLDINYKKYKLKNGLEVILHQNNELPLTAVNIWYKVGSANEIKGKTGLAHLFEHMMFQGSENVPKEMHFRHIQESGGSLNGSTSFDRTNFYEKVPSNFLELALWLESDRMGYFLPALTKEKLQNQIDVVSNERLERYDNQPYGLAWEIVLSNLYPDKHPYNWSTIGSLADIKGFTIDDVSNFFSKYYSPSNAALVIAGDINIDSVNELVEKYFAEIPGNKITNGIQIPSFDLNENIIINRKENVQLDRIYFAWKTVKAFDKDDASLDILTDILSGSKNSRLYKSLVFEKELAQDVTAFQFSGKYDGHFMLIATAKQNVNLNEIKKEIFIELEKIISNGIEEIEMQKSINGIKSSFIYSLQNLDTLADRLNSYNFFLGNPNSFNFDLNRYESVSIENIKTTLTELLNKNYLELRISPNN